MRVHSSQKLLAWPALQIAAVKDLDGGSALVIGF